MRRDRVRQFVDKWMPENENAIEFGRDFTDAITDIANASRMIAFHEADQENARIRDRWGGNLPPWVWFVAGIITACVLQNLG